MNIFINNEQELVEVPENIGTTIEDIAKIILEQEKGDTNYEVSITFVDDERIKELNRIYRQKDHSTDVLSFPIESIDELDSIEQKLNLDIEKLLGDVVISLQTAKRQAKSYGHSLKREIAYLVIHSMFHLLGYDHMEESDKRIMREKEKEIVKKIKIFKSDME